MFPPDSAPGAEPSAASAPSILLVDDDPFMLGMQARMLNSLGYVKVRSVGSAEAALARLNDDPGSADVIVCDLKMPGIDGIEFLKIVAAGAFSGGVIILSGEGTRVMHTVRTLLARTRIQVLGALAKPAEPAALQALLALWRPVAALPQAAPPSVFSEADLLAANRQHQWVVHYQPKVNLATGAVAGMEALVRWNRPGHGLVYPADFIDMADRCGAMLLLTEWLLAEATRQLSLWQEQGMEIHLAVNLSMASLRDPEFARRISAMVLESCASPRDVIFEIAEESLMTSPAALESLVRLRMQRFGLSIDDFGTGHSSLAQLRDLPFTELKIDKGFVHGAHADPLLRPMLEGSIGMARRLGLGSVAEGVESVEDWQLLRELECDLAQGYFIGMPMPVEDIAAWLELWDERRPGLVAP